MLKFISKTTVYNQHTQATTMNSSRKVDHNENENNNDVPSMFLRTPNEKNDGNKSGSIID